MRLRLLMLRAAITVSLTFLYILVIGSIVVVFGILFRQPEWIYQTGIGGVRLCLWLAGCKLHVEGKENLSPGRPCVYVCNHVSNIDPPAVAGILPRVVVLAKREVFRTPVFGRAMRECSFIPVDRGTERAALVVNEGVERLKRGFSILAFPEGTRSPSGEMLPFRHGVFLMAIRAQAPVVPISLYGTREMMKKGEPVLRPGTAHFVVHPAVPTDGLSESARGELADRVRDIVASALPGADRVAQKG